MKTSTSDFTTTILVDQTPQVVFKAINNVRGWWSEDIDGSTEKLNDEFIFRSDPYHVSTQKLLEVIPDKKVVWLVTDSKINFVANKQEWTGTKIIFEISKKGDKTQLNFTHKGLVPKIECYKDCSNAWEGIVQNSLFQLITTGKGKPSLKKDKSKTGKK